MNPPDIRLSPGALMAPGIDWLNTHMHWLFAAISTVIETVLGGLETALLSVPSYALIAVAADWPSPSSACGPPSWPPARSASACWWGFGRIR